MSGDVHVRFCEHAGVRLPRVTRLVMGFQYRGDALRMMNALKERLGRFGLKLHEDKSRLLEFGRLPSLSREQRGLRRCATFAFLGFTHYCGRTRDGRFVVKRKTQSERLRSKLKSLRLVARRRMHAPLAKQHRWLCQVLRGHYAYYGLPSNARSLQRFFEEVRRMWFRSLSRRSQRRLTWLQYRMLLERFPLPVAHLTAPRIPRLV